MQLVIKTKVKGNYKSIMEQFDLKLFKALAPKSAPMEIVEFTGSNKGDRVHIRFTSPINADWISLITDDGSNDQKAWFVDEGIKLPLGLSYWRHQHIVEKIDENSSYIIDDITYKGPNTLMTYLMYPGIFFGFYPRKKIYRKYFGPA